jgi:hypothetical protein
MVLTVAFATLLNAGHFYVDASRSDDSGDGTSWATAKRTIQAGVDLTVDYDTVWVTNGVYNEGVSVSGSETHSNRVSFYGKNVINLFAVSSDPADTVIVGAPDPDFSDGLGPKSIRCIDQGTWHNITVSGFTITNGYTLSYYGGDYESGGITGYHIDSAVVTNCVIVDCHSTSRGGGVSVVKIYDSIIKGCSTTVEGGGIAASEVYNSTIAGNTAGENKPGGGAFQGNYWNCVFTNNATYIDGSTSSGGAISRAGMVYDSLFVGNTAKDGGALDHSGTFIRCTFRNNHATDDAGVASTYRGGSYQFINCLMEGNTAADDAGVLYFYEDDADINTVVFENCTIVNNHADGIGSALLGHFTAHTNIFTTNCIVYANTDSSSGATNNYNDAVLMSYSQTTPMPAAGSNNITAAPEFVGDGNYLLKWGSPGIDQGVTIASITDDLDGNPRPVDGSGIGVALYDMGCYETAALPAPGGTVIIIN